MHEQSYLEASIDSVRLSENSLLLHLHIGPLYRWAFLDISALPPFLHSQVGSFQNDKPFQPQQINKLFEDILVASENAGYPFAAVRLDSIGIKDEHVRAKLQIALNSQFTIEGIKIEGNLKLSGRYLRQIIQFEEQDIFSREQIVFSRERLQDVPFVNQTKDPTVEFLGQGATVYYYLDKKNANRFDVLLGLLPSNNESQRFQLTGNVNIDLANQFGGGETVRLKYENLPPNTQNLDLDLTYPYIFDWSIGAKGQFELFKRDTSFIEISYVAGIEYFVGRNSTLTFYNESHRTNLLTIDTNDIKSRKSLPRFLDLSQNLFGIGFQYDDLDYRLNPRKGVALQLTTSLGRKKIKKNNIITSLSSNEEPPFDYGKLYSTLNLNSLQYKIGGDVRYFLPIFRNSTIFLQSRASVIGSNQPLFDNELYRIGGSNLLRGFNEQSIFASFYHIGSVEYRILFNRNSNIFLFGDFGYFERHTTSERFSDRPIGFGTGLNLETKMGIFSISYALGSSKNMPLSLRNGRIHFGMTSLF